MITSFTALDITPADKDDNLSDYRYQLCYQLLDLTYENFQTIWSMLQTVSLCSWHQSDYIEQWISYSNDEEVQYVSRTIFTASSFKSRIFQ